MPRPVLLFACHCGLLAVIRRVGAPPREGQTHRMSSGLLQTQWCRVDLPRPSSSALLVPPSFSLTCLVRLVVVFGRSAGLFSLQTPKAAAQMDPSSNGVRAALRPCGLTRGTKDRVVVVFGLCPCVRWWPRGHVGVALCGALLVRACVRVVCGVCERLWQLRSRFTFEEVDPQSVCSFAGMRLWMTD